MRIEELRLTVVGVVEVFKIINCVFKILQWLNCYVSVNPCCLSIHWFCSVPGNVVMDLYTNLTAPIFLLVRVLLEH